ncbi:MAG: ribbon-helix-helix domain-containing protein [Beijerinckiaceae bacterium]
MCEIFISADPKLYETRTRSLRLHGVSTSLRLENLFWTILTEIGARDSMTLNQLITKLYDELTEAGFEKANFASFLRVCCARYLSLQRDGRIPIDRKVPIRSLDPAFVLAEERRQRGTGGSAHRV